MYHNAETFRRGESFSVSRISGVEEVWIRGRGKYRNFPSKIFCLTVPKNVVGENFRVSLISGIEKFYVAEVYVTIFDFLSKFMRFTMLKISVGGNPLVFHQFRMSKKFV